MGSQIKTEAAIAGRKMGWTWIKPIFGFYPCPNPWKPIFLPAIAASILICNPMFFRPMESSRQALQDGYLRNFDTSSFLVINMPGSKDSMPKVDFIKDKANVNPAELEYIRLFERQNRERVLKLQKLRKSNLWTAGILGASVFGIYLYSMFAVKQENFLDDFNEPEREKAVN